MSDNAYSVPQTHRHSLYSVYIQVGNILKPYPLQRHPENCNKKTATRLNAIRIMYKRKPIGFL